MAHPPDPDEHEYVLGGLFGTKKVFYQSLVPSLCSGASSAIMFNPVDRALFLSMHHHRSFLLRENFTNPFHGFVNAAAYRTVSGASYFFWQDQSTQWLERHFSDSFLVQTTITRNCLIGVMSGTANGLMLNQMQTVKYRMWSDGYVKHAKFWRVARRMYDTAGPTIFFRGITVTITRDSVFGLVYEIFRQKKRFENSSTAVQGAVNCAAASLATAISAPLNYCRNNIYGAPTQSSPLTSWRMLRYLGQETMRSSPHWPGRVQYVNSRLNIGWSTIRVGFGMALTQDLFARYRDLIAGLRRKDMK